MKPFRRPHSLRVALALCLAGAPCARASGGPAPAVVIDTGARMTVATGTRISLPFSLINNGTFTPALGS